MRITDEVFIVGGGVANAFGLSDDPDCHVYLIDGGDELALIDCGMAAGDSLERILGHARADGLDPAKIAKVIVTHYHMDHAGGAARIRERLGVDVIAPAGAAHALRTGDERAVALDMAKAAGFYAQDYRFEPVEVAREVREGDHIAVGKLQLEVIETPGHCDGHASYLLHGRTRTYLFAGDAVFSGGRVVLQNIHDCSIQKSADSIAKLAQLEFDALLPGHAAICLDGGRRHVDLAFQACQSLFVPKNLV
ncbi:MAG: MBL fold metallo-hydrolase [Chloroflexia bacterium]|nr:MBL fold metallo-hydrolase [Chloroflexia bacterium]